MVYLLVLFDIQVKVQISETIDWVEVPFYWKISYFIINFFAHLNYGNKESCLCWYKILFLLFFFFIDVAFVCFFVVCLFVFLKPNIQIWNSLETITSNIIHTFIWINWNFYLHLSPWELPQVDGSKKKKNKACWSDVFHT